MDGGNILADVSREFFKYYGSVNFNFSLTSLSIRTHLILDS